MKTISMTFPKQGAVPYLVRCAIVGLAYAIANSLVSVLSGSLARQVASPENFLVFTLTGTLVCMAFSPFITHSVWSKARTILAVWAALTFARSFGLGIEGALFKPTSTATAVWGAFTGTVIGLLIAWLAVTLLMPENAEFTGLQPTYSWWGWTWRVLVVGLAYFLFYFIFGATDAFLYTIDFYKNNPQYGLNLPPTGALFMAELLRGPLFGLSALFLVRSTNLPRRSLGLWLGLVLFMIGGAAPYLDVTFRVMPLGFTLATLTELLFQNGLTGIVAASLFSVKSRQ